MLRTLAVPALLLLVFSTAVGQSRAPLRSFGDVKVNGMVAPSSIAVMDGDRIETGDQALR